MAAIEENKWSLWRKVYTKKKEIHLDNIQVKMLDISIKVEEMGGGIK